jgi:hypothetical protein
MKKTLAILVLSGLLALPLTYCKKSDELSAAEVNEIFTALSRVFDDAMNEANSSAMAAVRRKAESRHASGEITVTVDWEGTGRFEGISLKGSISVDPETGYYAGEYTFTITLYDASPSLQKTVIFNSAIGLAIFSGNAYQMIHHTNSDADFDMIIGTKPCRGTYEYDLEAAGTTVTLKGVIVVNGKEYALSS